MKLPTPARSLSAKLLLLTIVFVMLAEVLIYLPSVARFRLEWLNDRLGAAHLAALAVEAAPEAMVGPELEQELLRQVGAFAVDAKLPDNRVLMLAASEPPVPVARYDLETATPMELIGESLSLIWNASLRGAPSERVIEVTGPSPANPEVQISLLLLETPLCGDLLAFSGRILALSIIISVITAGLVYISLIYMTVRPMRRLADAMMAFKRDPESEAPAAQLATDRTDEVGVAQRELIAMQEAVRQSLRQRERLAALGQAVAKINHDIRGVLSSATLLSERLLDSDDPEVRRNGPRILDSLERAARLCTQTLAYSRDGGVPLHRQTLDLRELVQQAADSVLGERAAEGARMNGHAPSFVNGVPTGLRVLADREQMLRVLSNLGRNALEAGAHRLEVTAAAEPGRVTLTVADDGPGLPPRAVENLFVPFAGSTKAGGTGLGLPIAREVIRAHGGDIRLAWTSGEGTAFTLHLPATGVGR